MKKIPYGRHNITKADLDAVIEVLNSDFLTQGPNIKSFENAFAEYIGCSYAVAVSNGTAALHLAALALNVQPGDRVITTPITFSATANCVRYCGAEVIFSDIDPKTYTLDLNKLQELLESHPKGTFKGIIPVDLAGYPVNMSRLKIIADRFDLWIIEDACHAPGGFYKGDDGNIHKCGDGAFAELSVFSFHPVKHIAAGEGGMITTNDLSLYERLLTLRTHGIQQNPEKKIENHGVWYYEMQELGYNYRMTDFQAALGNSQLLRADEGLNRRRQIASRYNDFFNSKGYVLGHSGYVDGHAYHLYIIEIEDRKGLIEYLRDVNIIAQVHYIPVHMMPYYKKRKCSFGTLSAAEKYYSHCLSIPMYPTLTDEEQTYVMEKINAFFCE